MLAYSSMMWLLCLLPLALAAPTDNAATPLEERQAKPSIQSKLPPYTISQVRCDGVELVRRGRAISLGEATYIDQRSKKTGKALRSWLETTGENFKLTNTPTLAMVSSGGSYRAMLMGAGVVQAMDKRDTQAPTGGLYQAMTYHSGLSGGSWLLTTLFGNGMDTVSVLSRDLWERTLLKNGIYPLNTGSAPETPLITKDMIARSSFGLPVTVTDVWGRFIEWQTLRATDDKERNSDTVFKMSAIRNTQAFKNFEAPYPIMTALGMEKITGPVCDAADNATQYEMHPYEFGSWDDGVRAFTPMEYLGTKAENGKPSGGVCVQNFDTFSLLSGSSSSKFNEMCGKSQLAIIKSVLDSLLKVAQNGIQNRTEDLYGRVPNPFKFSELTPKVASANELYLVDGGQGTIPLQC
jgi:lysophospholipase